MPAQFANVDEYRKADSAHPDGSGCSPGRRAGAIGACIVGTWHGAAMSPAGEITMVLHVERGADATLSAKIENATQAPGNLAPVSDIKVTNGHLTFRMSVALNFAKGALLLGNCRRIARSPG
jgi:hypothetical protein